MDELFLKEANIIVDHGLICDATNQAVKEKIKELETVLLGLTLVASNKTHFFVHPYQSFSNCVGQQ